MSRLSRIPRCPCFSSFFVFFSCLTMGEVRDSTRIVEWPKHIRLRGNRLHQFCRTDRRCLFHFGKKRITCPSKVLCSPVLVPLLSLVDCDHFDLDLLEIPCSWSVDLLDLREHLNQFRRLICTLFRSCPLEPVLGRYRKD